MEEIDIKICLKKINKDYKNIKKITVKKKIYVKSFYIFFFTWCKNGTKSFGF